VAQGQAFYEAGKYPQLLALCAADLEGGQSDVVHDLLAYLAQQMITLNQQKQDEINGFLAWLAQYTGHPLDDWSLKTIARAYYEQGWDEFWRAVKRNKKAILKASGHDIEDRTPSAKIKKEFEASMAKLHPWLTTRTQTDALIDQIVYQLYGLTPDEIALVEASYTP